MRLCQFQHPYKTLQASYLEPEVLCGDNQYFCERCARKVDAERQVALRALPPYLCLSLQRFYFKPEVDRMVTVLQWLVVLCLLHANGATHQGPLAEMPVC